MLQAFKSLLMKSDLLTLGDLLFLNSMQGAGACQSAPEPCSHRLPTASQRAFSTAHQYSAFSINTNLANLVSGWR